MTILLAVLATVGLAWAAHRAARQATRPVPPPSDLAPQPAPRASTPPVDTHVETDRDLLVVVHRWARSAGWSYCHRGWVDSTHLADATVTVCWDEDGLLLWHRQAHGLWTTTPVVYPVASARQAVDVLVALDILPVALSSAHRAALAVTR